MPARRDLHSICVIGSGPIVIGQACEFDYAGCQALKVLREDGYRTTVDRRVVFFVRHGGEVLALSATCTHLDCTVQYRKDLGVIWCACHNGKYDFNGRNIAGPPPRPLDEYRVVMQGDEVYISKNT